MKIISQPPNENWTHKHTCIHCDAVLEVEKQDVKKLSSKYHATCAVCTRDFAIPENIIPKLVKLNAKEESSHYSGSNYGGDYWDR